MLPQLRKRLLNGSENARQSSRIRAVLLSYIGYAVVFIATYYRKGIKVCAVSRPDCFSQNLWRTRHIDLCIRDLLTAIFEAIKTVY